MVGRTPAGVVAASTAAAAAPAGRRRSTARPTGAGGSGRAGAEHATAQAAELPVRGDEERWNEIELAEVRARLDEEIDALRAEIAAAETQIAEGDTSDGAGDDQADTGAKAYAREHEMALAHNSRDLLVQNERAIARMDAGTYGICESCGRPIGKARLQAFPRATLCVPCKTREERR
jgi:DnaK suppressor protein